MTRSGWASRPKPKHKPSFNDKQRDCPSEHANFALGETQEHDEQCATMLATCFAHFGIDSVIAKCSNATSKVFSTCGLKMAIKKFGKPAKEAVFQEVKQCHDSDVDACALGQVIC